MKTDGITVAEWLQKGGDYLEGRGVPEARANCEFLLAEVLGVGRAETVLQGDRELSWKQGSHYWEYIKARGKRLPLAYVLGTQPFCGISVKVNPSVLVPRPETEGLVEEVVRVAETAIRFPRTFISSMWERDPAASPLRWLPSFRKPCSTPPIYRTRH